MSPRTSTQKQTQRTAQMQQKYTNHIDTLEKQLEEIKVDKVESTPATYSKFITQKDADINKLIPIKEKMCQPMETTYIIGRGPSSSHTIGPCRACHDFLKEYPNSQQFEVTTFGSFTLTGKGHYTFEVYDDELFYHNDAIKCEKNEENLRKHVKFVLISDYLRYHSNMFYIKSECGAILYCSPGGGKFERIDEKEMQFRSKEKPAVDVEEVANITKDIIYGNLLLFDDFQQYGIANNKTVYDIIFEHDKTAKEHLESILDAMIDSVNTGLQKEGNLYDNVPQYKDVKRQAKRLLAQAKAIKDQTVNQVLLIQAYATAAVEQSVTRGTVVTAPTLGSSGVCPGILSHYLDLFVPEDMTPNEKLQKITKEEREQLINALAIGGLISNMCYTTFSVSGTHGCQAEIGVASAMAAAMSAYLNVYISSKDAAEKPTIQQHWSIIEFAARTAMKCCEGLTCDPVEGYAIDPCIIRNATYAVSAWQIGLRAAYGVKDFYSCLDEQLMANKEIGEKLPEGFCEDSLGGLAKSTGVVRRWKQIKRSQEQAGKEAQEI